MKSIISGVAVFYFLAGIIQFHASAQAGNAIAQGGWCGTELLLSKEFAKNPEARKFFEEQYIKSGSLIQKMKTSGKSGAVQIIPVVVHVLHYNGDGNISKNQIESGIAVLNRDFRRLNADTDQTRSVFKPYAADPEFEFRLANIDPYGNCTEGIVRVNTPLTYNADDFKGIKSTSSGGSSPWPQDQYLNFWLVNTIEDNGGAGIILGYAILPGSWGWPSNYGAVVRNDYWGTTGTSLSDGRTATHEVGHCLGLLHTFDSGCGSSCSGSGDYICDTPPVSAETFSCVTTQNTCSNDMNGSSPFTSDMVDQIENYLSYDACQNMFSLGQKNFMKNTIASFSQLTNLVSGSNLTATGTNTGYIPSLCTPIGDFYSATQVICTGSTVRFTDASYNGSVTTRNWTFTGGSPSAATDSTPLITYINPGTFPVTLTVSNSAGSNTKTKSAYITVLPSPLKTIPYSENFETAAIPGTEWTIVNEDNGKTWGLDTTTGYNSSKSLRMNNYGNGADNIDEIISPTIDMGVISSGATAGFRVAYVQRTSSDNDLLRFFVSNDCGKTWAPRWAKTGASLASAPVQSSSFVPSDTSQWKTWSGISIYSSHYVTDFRFKFEFTSGGGNYVYIDDINITGTFNQIPVQVYPANFSTVPSLSALTLDWNGVSGVDTYEVQVDTLPDFSSPYLIAASYAYLSPDNSGTDTEHSITDLQNLRQYFWRVRSKTGLTPSNWSAVWRFTADTALGMTENPTGNLTFSVYPNPVEKNSIIAVMVHMKNIFTIDIIDVLGKRIPVAENKELPAGNHLFRLPELNSPGIYFVRIAIPGNVITKKILFIHYYDAE
ncbi:MAG: T9SS type A sorting domain-containing protein [Bacteroidetes bacterium]|nr:T9SS type A sorting domain-containing protein [Bacteroidota bacterium]